MKDKKNLLYNSLRPEDEVDFINKRNEIFMQDTTEGKLYKYRAVNKFSLSNLENGTMYCSSPKEFNDPFDCKLAMRMTSLGQTMWKHYVNAIINGYKLVEQEDKGKVNINDYTGNDKRIVQALLENSENKAMVCKIYFYTKLFPFPSKRTIFYKRALLCG
ncbi:MAG: hypothetical protein PUB44_07575 [Clostridium sp.]|nr:hypothetical protein [Clostridium sp.]